MSQFEGSKVRVRCIDCTKLSGTRCAAKNIATSPKKKRLCSTYVFKGEYKNRIPAAAIYMPHVDKKTKKMIQRLLNMGVVPVADEAAAKTQAGFVHTKSVAMPASTATATQIGTTAGEDDLGYASQDAENIDSETVFKSTVISDESENNRG